MKPGAGRRSPPHSALTALLRSSLVLLTAGSAEAAPDAAARAEAVQMVQTQRCEQAIPLLEQARRNDPGDARLPLLAGECQIRLRRYADAVISLTEVKRLDPRLPDVDLYLGIAHYHTGDLEAAERDFEAARVTSPGRAEVDLYLGMILLQDSRNEEAAAALQRARMADARAVEPVASYYEGLALLAAGQSSKGREALERVRELAPGSDWAAAAERSLQGAPGWGPRQSFFEAMVGTEWNTNVTLAGTEISPGEISGRRDLGTVWSATAGTEVYRQDEWAVGALASYYGNAHTTLYQFDLQYPGASIWVDRRLSDVTTFRFQSEINYAWYGYEPYTVLGGLTPSIFHSWQDYGLTWVYAKFYGGDYFFDNFDIDDSIGPPGVDEERQRNRDGWGVTAGFLHTANVKAIDTELRGGFNYYHYWSVGTEWRYDGYEVILGFRRPLPYEFVLDGQAGFVYRPFYHPSTYPENNTIPLVFPYAKRRDNAWQFEVKLERPINSWLKASARYYYLDNGSNTPTFNYRQQIWGAYLTVNFRQE